jgi:hypothetical protein
MVDITRGFIAYQGETIINCCLAIDNESRLFFKDERKYLKPLYFPVIDLDYYKVVEIFISPNPSISFKIEIDGEEFEITTEFEKPGFKKEY